MAFNPNKPVNGEIVDANFLRAQFNALKALVDDLAARVAALESPPSANKATNPNPANGAVNVPLNLGILSFMIPISHLGLCNLDITINGMPQSTILGASSGVSVFGILSLMQWPANATITWTVSLQQPDGSYLAGDSRVFHTAAM